MIKKAIYKFWSFIYRAFFKIFITPGMKAVFGACGTNVRISYDVDVRGAENIYIGNNCQIGPKTLLWSTRAKIIIKDSVLMGPGITIVTGDHRTDVIGKQIIDVLDIEKLPEHDQDVVIESGVWLASNVTILKGVTIGEGAIVAAGAIVTKDVEPYSIYAGIPAKKVKDRFPKKDLERHLEELDKNKILLG